LEIISDAEEAERILIAMSAIPYTRLRISQIEPGCYYCTYGEDEYDPRFPAVYFPVDIIRELEVKMGLER